MNHCHEDPPAYAPDSVDRDHEVIVVGGGQAGLALGYFLTRQQCDFAIFEAADEPAAAWRARWDSLKLFTPVRYSGLPGLPFAGDPDSYPGKDEVAAYLTEGRSQPKVCRRQNGQTFPGAPPARGRSAARTGIAAEGSTASTTTQVRRRWVADCL